MMVVFKSNFSYDYVVYQRGFQAVVTAGTSQLNTHLSAPPATHGKTAQSVSCELHDCSEHAQTSIFEFSIDLSRRESNAHQPKRTRHRRDSFFSFYEATL